MIPDTGLGVLKRAIYLKSDKVITCYPESSIRYPVGASVDCPFFREFFLRFGYIKKCLFILAVIGVMCDQILKTSQCCQIVTCLKIEMTDIKFVLCNVNKTFPDISLGLLRK